MLQKKPWYRSSTVWIFFGLLMGVVLGGFLPKDQHPMWWELFHFLSKGFIALIKGLIVPLLFSTIVVGIAQTGDMKAVGRMGGKALIYFEIVTTFALFIGLAIANVVKPGANLPLNLEAHGPVVAAQAKSGWDIAMHMFPSNLMKHAAEGDILPVVVFATLFGIALTHVGDRGKPVLAFFDGVAQTMFKYTDMVMMLTPLGVFGSMAFNVSEMAAGHEVA
ncbi:MAG: cation:dicarboxylase symporter family transporter, partial [Acidobacteriota bacterium]|nr:cation:dicarboxylase symporter family transporter [Acidobacteriota bacterium]